MKNHETTNQRVLSLSKTRKTNEKGLTLVELLGAVAIVVIVAAIAILSVAGTFRASQEAAIMKQEMELNRAYTSYLSLGGIWTNNLESALGQLATPLTANGITNGPWAMEGSYPRSMSVGLEQRYLALFWAENETGEFASNAWVFRYLTQEEIDAQTPATPTPTPVATPTPTPTPPPQMFTVTLEEISGGFTGSYTKAVATYEVENGAEFTVGVVPSAGAIVGWWAISPWPEGQALPTGNNLAFPVTADTTVSVVLNADPAYIPEPTPTPTPPEPATRTITFAAATGADSWEWPVTIYRTDQGWWEGVPVPGEIEVENGATVQLYIIAEAGFRLAGLDGAGLSQYGYSEGESSFVANRDYVITPQMRKITWVQTRVYDGSMNIAPSAGNLTITPTPWDSNGSGQMLYDVGQQLTISATPSAGWLFQGWMGSVPGGTPALNGTITVQQGTTVFGQFRRP